MKDLSVYVLVSFIACVTPGSGVLYTVTNGLRGGLRTVLASPLGTTLGVGLMSLISATGLGALITSSPALYAGLQLVSAAVLFWLGWGSWNAGAVRLDKLARILNETFRKPRSIVQTIKPPKSAEEFGGFR